MSDVHARLEEMARGGARFRPLRQVLVEAVLVVASLLLLAYVLYAAQFSGTVRWFLGFALIAAFASYAWYVVARGTSEPAPLVRAAPPLRRRAGELEIFTRVVHRASQGLPYSQVAVSSRAREAFEERVRLSRGISWEAMRRLQRDAGGLAAAFRDPLLVDFLYLPTSDTDARYRWVMEARSRQGFDAELLRILDRMEGWR